MNKEKEHIKLIPKLRFPEFKDSGEWVEMAIKKVCEKPFSGGTPSSANKKYYGGNIPFIRSAEINKETTELYITELGLKNSSAKMVKKGDVLVAMYGANSGDVAICKINGAINQAILCLRSKSNNEFLSQYLAYKKEWIRAKYLQGGQGNLSSDIIKTIELLFPLPQEQQKIADFLSNLDELIEAHKQKQELLKQHKKGLMQNLFPQEGEKVPKLRFPEFKDSGEWEFYNGNEFFDTISNKNHNSDLPVLAITQDKGAIPRDMIDFTVITSKQSIKNYKVVEIGDFIISLRSFQGGIEYSNYQGICSPAYIILRKKVELENLFFKYYFKTPLYIRFLNKNLEGIRDGKMVSYKQFSEIKLPFPSIHEQQKIASCLSSIDEIITAEAEMIKQLEKYKKGLMQGLFPVS